MYLVEDCLFYIPKHEKESINLCKVNLLYDRFVDDWERYHSHTTVYRNCKAFLSRLSYLQL